MNRTIVFLMACILWVAPLRAQRDSVSWGAVGTSAGLFALGVGGHFVPTMQHWNVEAQDYVQQWRNEGPLQGRRIHADDYLQWAPLPTMYLLKLCGVPSRDNYLKMTTLAAEAYLTMGLLSVGMKYACAVQRPDGSAANSFPSGHTATAFCGAELLRLEYRNATPWVGIVAYSAATLTGAMRVYNNRHWTADVLGGAGVGILSAQIANFVNQRLFVSKPAQPVAENALLNDYILE